MSLLTVSVDGALLFCFLCRGGFFLGGLLSPFSLALPNLSVLVCCFCVCVVLTHCAGPPFFFTGGLCSPVCIPATASPTSFLCPHRHRDALLFFFSFSQSPIAARTLCSGLCCSIQRKETSCTPPPAPLPTPVHPYFCDDPFLFLFVNLIRL